MSVEWYMRYMSVEEEKVYEISQEEVYEIYEC